MADFVRVKGSITFSGKRYRLRDSYVSKKTANRLKAVYKKQGYLVRIVQGSGVMHFLKRYHVYVSK